MSDSNRVRLSFAQEATYGTQPNATLKDLRITGESLKQATNTVTSQELRSDRNIPDLLRTNANVDGDINFELSCQSAALNFDDWWRIALGSAVSYPGFTSVTLESLTFTSAGASTYSGTILRGSAWTFPVGRWIRVQAGTGAANLGWWKITAIGTTSVANDTLTVVGHQDMVSGASTGATVRCHGSIVNGTTQYSMTLVKQFLDLSADSDYEIYTGCMIDRVSLSVTADQIITGSWSLLGKNAQSHTGNYLSGADVGYTAAPTNIVLTGVNNVVAVMEDNAPFVATGFTFQLSNNLRARQVIGTFGAYSIGQGSVTATGTLTAYFASKTIMDKYLNATASTLSLIVAETPTEVAGSYQIWDFQQVKFTSGQVLSTGLNGDVMVELAWQALLESSETEAGNHTVRYTRG